MKNTTTHPLVSIITVNYEQVQVTLDLLQSLDQITYPNYEVIVVDNGSQKSPSIAEVIKHRNARIIYSKENLGFAGGNNLGVEAAHGEYLLFINNDTEVPVDFLEPLVDTFRTHPDAGMVSPKIKYFHTPDTIQYAGYNPINKMTLRGEPVGKNQKDAPEYNQFTKTNFAHGAAMMVPRKVIEEVGTMFEDYFLYYEELDWAARIKKAGYNIYYNPASYILHKESMSVGKQSAFKLYYLTRNRILFARRNFSWGAFLINICYLIGVSIPVNTLRNVRKPEYLKSYYKGLFWNFTYRANSDSLTIIKPNEYGNL